MMMDRSLPLIRRMFHAMVSPTTTPRARPRARAVPESRPRFDDVEDRLHGLLARTRAHSLALASLPRQVMGTHARWAIKGSISASTQATTLVSLK
jgi:hypothetical protein